MLSTLALLFFFFLATELIIVIPHIAHAAHLPVQDSTWAWVLLADVKSFQLLPIRAFPHNAVSSITAFYGAVPTELMLPCG